MSKNNLIRAVTQSAIFKSGHTGYYIKAARYQVKLVSKYNDNPDVTDGFIMNLSIECSYSTQFPVSDILLGRSVNSTDFVKSMLGKFNDCMWYTNRTAGYIIWPYSRKSVAENNVLTRIFRNIWKNTGLIQEIAKKCPENQNITDFTTDVLFDMMSCIKDPEDTHIKAPEICIEHPALLNAFLTSAVMLSDDVWDDMFCMEKMNCTDFKTWVRDKFAPSAYDALKETCGTVNITFEDMEISEGKEKREKEHGDALQDF